MGILSWIVFGLIAGLVAKLLMPGRDPGGFIITILLGIAGAVVGGLIAGTLGYGGVDGFNIGSFFVAVIGAVVLLALYRFFARRSSSV
ncbi:MAG TPA: GlsB/YeaQ/YmgE family stress response membrane protein [Rhodocyclaceae bacterium]|nr:GlsB/YeaQ/YmgE family stress response membrane protein [Rhodocyclaceae bacterium]